MQRIFSNSFYTNNKIDCPECDWEGKASETKQEHLFLTDALELHCPNCNKYLGFVDQSEEEHEKEKQKKVPPSSGLQKKE